MKPLDAKGRAVFPVVVHVVLRRADELFLLRRAGTGFMDGYFGLPGGHQEHGESVSEAARRECLEETGVVVEGLQPVVVYPYSSRGHQGMNFVFVADAWEGTPRIGEPDKADLAQFFPMSALPRPVAPWLEETIAILRAGTGFQLRELHWD